MPLYQIISDENVSQVKPSSFQSEKELQTLFERSLEKLIGVRFIATEFTTGDRQKGRIDTLGLDQDGSPTIIEYKKSSKENVINQGLIYMDWLVDHKGDFMIAVQETLGQNIEVDWSQPRLMLIAESFSEYDKYAVNRIGANIELWVYRRYGDSFLYLEPLFTSTPIKEHFSEKKYEDEGHIIYTLDHHTKGKNDQTLSLFNALQERIFHLAEEGEILEKSNKNHISYKHGKNFCEVKIQANGLKLWIDVPFEEIVDPHHLCRDVSNVGHHGNGDIEIKINDEDNIDNVMELIDQSYQLTT